MLDLDKQRIAARLILDEGTGPVKNGRYYPYVDTRGNVTIGTGRNLTGFGLSDDERAYLLNNDILSAVFALGHYPWFDSCPSVIQDVLICIMFNLGPDKFAGFRKAIDALSRKDYAGAASEFADSAWATEVGHRADVYETILRTQTWPESS